MNDRIPEPPRRASATIRILLADPQALVRSGLRALLAHEPDLEIVGEAADGFEALGLARERSPRVVLMELALPGLNGFEATRRIAAELPGVRVVCLSILAEGPFVAAAVRCGAAGYLFKSCGAEELLQAIRTVAHGRTYLSPAVSAEVIRPLCLSPRGEAPSSAFEILTPREREVLQLLAEGFSSKRIAGRLAISVKTVGTYRERLMRKLGIDSVAGLTRYAIAQGLTAPLTAV